MNFIGQLAERTHPEVEFYQRVGLDKVELLPSPEEPSQEEECGVPSGDEELSLFDYAATDNQLMYNGLFPLLAGFHT